MGQIATRASRGARPCTNRAARALAPADRSYARCSTVCDGLAIHAARAPGPRPPLAAPLLAVLTPTLADRAGRRPRVPSGGGLMRAASSSEGVNGTRFGIARSQEAER